LQCRRLAADYFDEDAGIRCSGIFLDVIDSDKKRLFGAMNFSDPERIPECKSNQVTKVDIDTQCYSLWKLHATPSIKSRCSPPAPVEDVYVIIDTFCAIIEVHYQLRAPLSSKVYLLDFNVSECMQYYLLSCLTQ